MYSFRKKICKNILFYVYFVILLLLDAIETNVEDGAANIEEGTSQLQKAAQYQRRHRRRLCYLAIIGLIILIIIITVIVVEMKR